MSSTVERERACGRLKICWWVRASLNYIHWWLQLYVHSFEASKPLAVKTQQRNHKNWESISSGKLNVATYTEHVWKGMKKLSYVLSLNLLSSSSREMGTSSGPAISHSFTKANQAAQFWFVGTDLTRGWHSYMPPSESVSDSLVRNVDTSSLKLQLWQCSYCCSSHRVTYTSPVGLMHLLQSTTTQVLLMQGPVCYCLLHALVTV